LIWLAAGTPAPARAGHAAQDSARTAPVIVPRADCSASAGADEILVCGRRNDREKYRIPEGFRDEPISRDGTSWAARSRELQESQRNEDQVSGPFAYIKWMDELVRDWRADRDEKARVQRKLERDLSR
jgi:hypothetical protein